jgi:Ni/Co efflux regulator RcnB
MKRLVILTLGACLLQPPLSMAQPPGGRAERPNDNRGRPDRPVTLPAPVPDRPGRPDRPGMGNPVVRPPQHRPPAMRPPPRPNRPQFSWRGRWYNPVRGPSFRYPPGYAYRRWAIGAFLPGLFLATSYYYDDWRGLGIEPPPPGRRWVRYGPDLLLVNLRNRRVEDVIYGVFY